MKIQCDVCEKSQATVICCADEAALCAKCDVEVHAANKLASKHQRLQLHSLSSKLPSCDICQEKAAFIFCVEDRALFCQECDQTIHLASSLAGDHQRYLATGIRVALGSKCTKEAEKKCIDPSNQSAQQISIKPNVNQPPTVPSPGWAVDDLLEFSELESTIKFQTTTGVESQSVEVPSFTTQPEDGDDLHQETQHSGCARAPAPARARARDSAPASAPSAPDGDSTKTRRCNWNEDEDMRLVSGYLNTSKDPITNTNQSGETFWSRVSTEWNKYKKHGQPVRDSKSCKNRWQTIDRTVSKFCGCYGRSIRQQASGESEDDVLNRALSTYHEDELGPFTNLHAWEVLRHEPKWSQLILDVINRNNPSSASAASSKRSRSDMESDTPNANTPTSAFSGYAIERPEGIKACKRKGKKVASASCDKEDELANEMFRQKEAMLSKAHELAMTKEAHKREKQTHFAKMKSMEMEMEQKKMEMENAQIKRAEIQHNWEMLQFLMGQTNLGHNGETLKQKLMKELSETCA